MTPKNFNFQKTFYRKNYSYFNDLKNTPDFFEGPRRFRGPQKSEKFYFSKHTKTSVDHKFKSFAILSSL